MVTQNSKFRKVNEFHVVCGAQWGGVFCDPCGSSNQKSAQIPKRY